MIIKYGEWFNTFLFKVFGILNCSICGARMFSKNAKKHWELHNEMEDYCSNCGSTNVSVSQIDSDYCHNCKNRSGWFPSREKNK